MSERRRQKSEGEEETEGRGRGGDRRVMCVGRWVWSAGREGWSRPRRKQNNVFLSGEPVDLIQSTSERRSKHYIFFFFDRRRVDEVIIGREGPGTGRKTSSHQPVREPSQH